MTDLDLTKACAEAMGFYWAAKPDEYPYIGMHKYDPLHNDAQAMALVKRFRLQLDPHDEQWNVALVGKAASLREDLNRAIVECVAKLKERPC